MGRARTLQTCIDAASGHTTGFDVLRVLLAVSVIIVHSVGASYGFDAETATVWAGPARGVFSLILPMFFALSGFLVAGSLERVPEIHKFLTLRAVRIIPALFVETVLCALIVGPLLTTESLGGYFTDPVFFHYFRNVVGDVQFNLPGVFAHNPVPDFVNLSLWTVPFELFCYIALAGLAVLTITKRPAAVAWLVLGACLILPAYYLLLDAPQVFMHPKGRVLVLSFLCGIVVYQWRRLLPHSWTLAAASGVLAVICLSHPHIHSWAAPFVAYLTAFFGLLQLPKPPVFSRGDYSYGMYLFAYPIQQAFVELFPDAREWYFNVAFTVVLALAYAMFSWHVVEKPILSRRKHAVAFVDAVVTSVLRRVQRWAPAVMRADPES